MYQGHDGSSSPKSEPILPHEDTGGEAESFAFEGNIEPLEGESASDAFSSNGLQMDVDVSTNLQNEASSDGLFDMTFDELNSEELQELDCSLNVATQVLAQTSQTPVDEDESLFADGYDELMELDFADTQPEV